MSLSRKISAVLAIIFFIFVLLAVLARMNPVPAGNGALFFAPGRILNADERVWDGAFSPDGKLFATACVNGKVAIWNVDDGTTVRTLVHPQGVTSLAFTPDGQILITGSFDSQVRRWRVADGTL